KFDQSAQWGEVSQGPESFLPERIKLHFSGSREDQAPISSGFGPFALTRLTIETGGQYIPVHPNRQVGKDLKRSDTAAYAAYFKRFFDPQRMRLYQPDYVSSQEYMRRINGNKMRSSLMQAAAKSWLTPMAEPQVRFVKRDEATFSTMLSEAQKGAAILEPRVNQLYQVLKLGESERPQENSARWQAGYDLAMGRVMAVKARTEAYNAMLAKAKRGLKFKNPKS
ncbi:MAG: VWA domain-containing protein, partial [Planctomycetaceae bacterium]|nr:VWA domain-containing protein [Planctomycetaceae bacterium]